MISVQSSWQRTARSRWSRRISTSSLVFDRAVHRPSASAVCAPRRGALLLRHVHAARAAQQQAVGGLRTRGRHARQGRRGLLPSELRRVRRLRLRRAARRQGQVLHGRGGEGRRRLRQPRTAVRGEAGSSGWLVKKLAAASVGVLSFIKNSRSEKKSDRGRVPSSSRRATPA